MIGPGDPTAFTYGESDNVKNGASTAHGSTHNESEGARHLRGWAAIPNFYLTQLKL